MRQHRQNTYLLHSMDSRLLNHMAVMVTAEVRKREAGNGDTSQRSIRRKSLNGTSTFGAEEEVQNHVQKESLAWP